MGSISSNASLSPFTLQRLQGDEEHVFDHNFFTTKRDPTGLLTHRIDMQLKPLDNKADADIDEELKSFMALLEDSSTIDEEFLGSQLASPEREKLDAGPVIGYQQQLQQIQLEARRTLYGQEQSACSSSDCPWRAWPADEGRDAHVPGLSNRQAQLQDSSEVPSGSLSFKCWNLASNQEEDSPSTGNNGPEQSPAKASAEQPDGSLSSGMDQASLLAPGESDGALMEPAPKGASALEASMELSPLPDSPTGLAPVRLDNEVHVGASDQAPPPHEWLSDVLPITQAPGVSCESPDMCANPSPGDTAELEDSPVEKGLSPMPPSQDGALNVENSAQRETVLGTLSRALGRVTGIFAKKAPEASKPPGITFSPSLAQGPVGTAHDLNKGSPTTVEARLLSRLPASPRADQVKAGLHIIEQVHQLGPENLRFQALEPPPAGGEGLAKAPEVVMGRGDSAVAEAISEAVQTPQCVAAAVVAVQLDGNSAKASLPPVLEGTQLGASIAQESIAVVEAVVEEGVASGALPEEGPSRKRSAEDVGASQEAGTDAQPPRGKRRRHWRTGMEVVWQFFGGTLKPEESTK
ncbi:hypothetical protein COCOBI_01-3450 [Coccomyxa sp. Obi]|nr:hypothetical protein COCOBI_01-3450 [Coccomyxa sp. Obi]